MIVTPAPGSANGLSNIASAVVEKNKKVTMSTLSVPTGLTAASEKKQPAAVTAKPRPVSIKPPSTTVGSGKNKKKKKGARDETFPIPLA